MLGEMQGVRFEYVEGMGVGAVSSKTIEPSDTVMKVPLEILKGGSWQPVAITTETVLSHTGPLGAVGRALSVLGGKM